MNWLRNNLFNILLHVLFIGGALSITVYVKMQHWDECRQFHGTAYCLFLRRF